MTSLQTKQSPVFSVLRSLGRASLPLIPRAIKFRHLTITHSAWTSSICFLITPRVLFPSYQLLIKFLCDRSHYHLPRDLRLVFTSGNRVDIRRSDARFNRFISDRKKGFEQFPVLFAYIHFSNVDVMVLRYLWWQLGSWVIKLEGNIKNEPETVEKVNCDFYCCESDAVLRLRIL